MTERIKISEIYPIQTRESNDPAVVAEYAEAMEAGTEFPPISVVHDGKRYWMWDGHHRLAAARQSGMQDFPCDVAKGSEAEARWMACSANQTHGLRRTNADKRRAVTLALELHPEKSDRAIAEHCGVSNKFVGDVRQVCTVHTSEESAPRVGKDGKTYPVKPAPPAEESGPVAPDGLVDELAAWLKKGHLEASEAGILAREHEAVQIAAYDYLAAHPKVSACQGLAIVRRKMATAVVLPADKEEGEPSAIAVREPDDAPAAPVVHAGPGEAADAIADALLENNGLKVMQAAVLVAAAELRKAFTRKWVSSLNAAGRREADKLLNRLMNEIEAMQKEIWK